MSTSNRLAQVFERVGTGITGDRRQGPPEGAGYEKVHVADPTTPPPGLRRVLAATEGDNVWLSWPCRRIGFLNRGSPVAGFLSRTNGPPYRSDDWRKACRALDLKPIRTKALPTPQTNGKGPNGSFKTILSEWGHCDRLPNNR